MLGSWTRGSLKFFHHDLRSRFEGGEAGLAPGGLADEGGGLDGRAERPAADDVMAR